MRIAYDNDFDNDTAPTVTSEDSSYPFSNTRDQRLTTTWRSTTASAQTITLAPAMSLSESASVAILGHNLSSSATVTLSLHDVDVWDNPLITTSLTVVEGVILKFFDATSYDGDSLLMETGDKLLLETGDEILLEIAGWAYARFVITDTTNADGYVEAGRFFLGPYMTVDPSSLHDFRVIKKRSDTVIYGKDRQKFSVAGYGWRRFELEFPPTNGTTLSSIQTMFDTVGNHASFVFANFDSLRSSDGAEYEIVEPCYVSIDGDLEFRRSGNAGMRFTYSLSLEEDR